MKSAGAIQKNTEKRASHDVLFSLCENAADKLILFVLLGSVLLFILWPIACIALRSLRGADGGVSFAMFGTVLRQYGESLRNSVFVGVFTAVLSTILSLSAALVCATARRWKKTLCMIIMLGQNYQAFLAGTIDWAGVVATYIGIPLFLAIWLGYKLITGCRFVRYSDMKFPEKYR